MQAFSAFTNDVIWLIVVSFFFAAVRSLLLCAASIRSLTRSASAGHGGCGTCWAW
jgi:hypothetical protein